MEEELKEGELKCSKCLGEGEVLPRDTHYGVERCPKCRGYGKIDWIENVVSHKIHTLCIK